MAEPTARTLESPVKRPPLADEVPDDVLVVVTAELLAMVPSRSLTEATRSLACFETPAESLATVTATVLPTAPAEAVTFTPGRRFVNVLVVEVMVCWAAVPV